MVIWSLGEGMREGEFGGVGNGWWWCECVLGGGGGGSSRRTYRGGTWAKGIWLHPLGGQRCGKPGLAISLFLSLLYLQF